MTERRRRGWVWLAGTVGVLLLMRLWVLEPVRIPSGSMEPTLHPGQHVLVEKVTRHAREWRYGEVVLFSSPADGSLTVKRIVGLPGDRVGIRDGRLVVDGQRVVEPWADPDRIDSVYFGPARVPEDHVFVLGDNRRDSRDSRSYGAVPDDDLEGRVVTVLWPLRDAGGLR